MPRAAYETTDQDEEDINEISFTEKAAPRRGKRIKIPSFKASAASRTIQ